jgi:hypothetical protein
MCDLLEIVGCTGPKGEEVLAFGSFTYFPPRRHGSTSNDTFANFNISWNNGAVERRSFKVKVLNSRPGRNVYRLVVKGDDLVTAEFGLQVPGEDIFWAKQEL